jgi:glucose-1-phosphate thymidylyltransferase
LTLLRPRTSNATRICEAQAGRQKRNGARTLVRSNPKIQTRSTSSRGIDVTHKMRPGEQGEQLALCFLSRFAYSGSQMKGIILAGGAGSRLFPLTLVASKQLQPVYDKPMVYYPLTTLIEGGIREFCLISTPHDIPRFKQLLGDGSAWGLHLEYREQAKPEGIAQAFLIAESFVGKDPVTLILGDNIFYGGESFYKAFAEFKNGATIFGYHVNDPERYGVVEFDANGQALSIEEKPRQPKSNYAVPGLYIYDNSVLSITRNLKPSARGELEITDVNVEYLRRSQLRVHRLGRGFAWLDAGTSSSLHEASAYVQTIEKRQGVKIGCPEEASFRQGFLSHEKLDALTRKLPNCEYRVYLENVVAEAQRLNPARTDGRLATNPMPA